MADSDLRERSGRSHRTGRAGFDLISTKLGPPLLRPGTVRRAPIIQRLASADPPIVSVVAPPGYGKTTLLSQWAESGGPPFAWVSVDEQDNEPKVLLRYIAEALDRVEPIPERVFDTLASPRSSVPGSVVPRLGSAFSSMTSPVVLVLDDVHVLQNRECRASLSVLADHVPHGSRLALAGRTEPPLRISRLRAEGRVLEIGPDQLSLTSEEAASLLRNADVALGDVEVAELHRRTEGWPVGLYLAALYLKEGGAMGSAAVSFGGADRLVSEYMESEFLSRISRRRRAFLTRTAVLDRMCGPLCDAVLDGSGSATVLASLERSNLLVVPLDRQGEWYRYHSLFRDMLLDELHRGEPEMIPVLHRRAADWCLRNGLPEDSLEYSIAAGDVDAVARLVVMLGVPTYRQGRIATTERWIRWLEDRGGVAGNPMISVLASMLFALTGQAVSAERWAETVDRWHDDATRPDDPLAEAWAALLRTLLCRGGVERMHADAHEALRRFAEVGFVTPTPALTLGIARVLSGDLDGGDEALEDAVNVAEEASSAEDLALALCERALVAMTRGDWVRVEALAERARAALRKEGFEESFATPVVCAVHARAALHRGDVLSARQELVAAQRLRPELTYVLPHFAVQARNELIRVHIALADLGGARTLMREVDDVLRRRPDMGSLVGEAEALRARLSQERGSIALGASTLTTAELRLLPILSTHLPFREIAANLFLSPNTVKSQAISIYRKLGVSSRSQAIARSRELGLLEA
ncbi:MAG: LuxR C-terminal-related transcriptional regulator [Actinomycetota bacterium]